MKKVVSKEVSEQTLGEMCTDKFKNDFSNLLRSRYPLFFITTNEERRLIQFLDHFCRIKGYECMLWDSYNGLVSLENREMVAGTTEDLRANPLAVLDYIITESRTFEKKKTSIKEKKDSGISGVIYVLLDFFRFITDNPDIERRFKTIAELNSIICTIVTGPYYKATDVIQNLMPVIDFPFATKKEIKHALYDVVKGASVDIPDLLKRTKEMEEELIDAVNGLTLMEAQTAFSKSMVAHHDWNLPTILEEKKQIISKSGMLDYFDKPVSMDDVGGLKRLVAWIKNRKSSFSEEAEKYGLKKPRGLLNIGMPGTGKSLICKAISSAWGMPLLRLDFGRLFGSLVGDSEKNARETIKLAEAVAPCILGDTKIIVNGKTMLIENLFKMEKNDNKNEVSVFNDNGEDIQHIVYLNKEKKIKIRGIDKRNIKDLSLKAITRTFKKEKLIKITTKSGRVIMATRDHLLMGNKQKMKKIKDFQVNDLISIVYDNKIQGDIDGDNKTL
jgi:hypothetical protein